ncbi:protein trafficking PGA2 domain-containing protein [Sarocladium implicatum]|nr:protein trafficking PGA2 domain-containing protein [Sarocladium implicatum]
MSSPAEHQEAPDAELNDFGRIIVKLAEYGGNASRNLHEAFTSMTMQHYLRLVVIIGGYILLRPQLLKFVGRGAAKQMEKRDAMEKAAAQAEISANQLRTGKAVVEEDEDEYYEGQGTGADWGAKARTRQRLMLKKLMEAEERRKEEEDEDKDIADLLED